jgi:hypothetical protein
MTDKLESVDITEEEVDEVTQAIQYLHTLFPNKKFFMVIYDKDSRPKSGMLARIGSNMSNVEIGLAVKEIQAAVSQHSFKIVPAKRKQ